MESQAATASLPLDAATAIRELQAQCRRLRLLAIAAMLGVIALGSAALAERFADQRLLRTRGIVIEDAEGRDRILIGTPIPRSDDRVRDDPARSASQWGPRFGGAERFAQAYQNMQNTADGVVFLNEQGLDTLLLADRTPDSVFGKRRVESSGLTWNDDKGFELGGLGSGRTPDGKHCVVLGMDDPEGGEEAAHLFLLEDGTKGLRIASKDFLFLLGRAAAGNPIFGNASEFAGFMIKDKDGKVVLDQNVIKQ